MCEHFDHAVAQFAHALAEFALELFRRGAEREIGLRADEIHHGFGLREIHLPIQIRALRELARLRRPRPIFQQQLQNPPRNQHATVAGDLHDILAGVTRGRWEMREQHLVQLSPAIMDRSEVRESWCELFRPAKNRARHFHRPRPAQAQQRNRAFAKGRGDGGDGVGHAKISAGKDSGKGVKAQRKDGAIRSFAPLREIFAISAYAVAVSRIARFGSVFSSARKRSF